jgi:hypothetical protein
MCCLTRGDAHDAARTCADFSTAFKADLDREWLSLLAILGAMGAARAVDVRVPECRTTPARLAFIPVTEVKAITSAGRAMVSHVIQYARITQGVDVQHLSRWTGTNRIDSG